MALGHYIKEEAFATNVSSERKEQHFGTVFLQRDFKRNVCFKVAVVLKIIGAPFAQRIGA